MTAETWVAVSDGLRERGPAVANHLWQSTGFLLVAALLTLALRQNQARVRFWVWMAVSLKFLVPFALLASLAAHLVPPRVAVTADSAVYFAVENASEPFVLPAFAPPVTPARPHVPVLPLVVAGVWLAGFVAVLVLWAVRWARVARVVRAGELISSGREYEALRRSEAAAGLRPGTIQLRAVAGAMEPGVFGVWMPVLAWPAAISGRLHEEHLEAVLAHEVAHVRRRDNLTAAVHMLIEATFWFHPLVWWVGSRMMAERERACDEEVVRLGGAPGAYAEGILKVCAFCVESPVPCVSGVTGADLKKRIVEIMSGRAIARLGWGKQLLLGCVAIVSVTLPLLAGTLRLTRSAHLQTVPAASGAPQPETVPEHLRYDVVSIRPADPNLPQGTSLRFTDDGFQARGVPFEALVRVAYHLGFLQGSVEGVPGWAQRGSWDVEARVPESDIPEYRRIAHDFTPAGEARRDAILRNLLTDYFGLRAHVTTKEGTIYALVVAKGGPKLQPGSNTEQPSLLLRPRGHMQVRNATVAAVAPALAQEVGRTVVDRTGLTGKYDFTLHWTPDRGPSSLPGQLPSPDAPPSLFTAIQEQLGLKLEPQKGPVKYLVIDHADKPTVDGSSNPSTPPALVGQVDQTAPAEQPKPLAFEVVSIRRNPAPMGPQTARFEFRADGDGLTLQDILLSSIIGSFYGYDQTFQSGMPAWANSECYDIRAKVAEADLPAYHKLTKEQRKRMVQALLEDRFKLRTHVEQREGPVYLLKVANGGPKLQAAPAGEVYTSGPRDSNGNYAHSTVFVSGPGEETAHAVAMTGFAKSLQPMVGRTVIDQTGLTGAYDFTFKWDPSPASDGPSIFTALEEQLGLKLVPAKGTVETLVIDHIERPSEN